MANYYDILGVSKNATDAEIKKAYRKAAVKWHPDRWSNKSKEEQKKAEEMFKQVAEANEVLSDPDKRSRYNRFGDNWDKVNTGGFSSSFDADGMDLGSFFRNMHHGFSGFGNFTQQGPEPGATIKARIYVDINDIFNGNTRELDVKVEVRCKDCHGSGGDKETCPHCHGTGYMRTRQQFGPNQFVETTRPCEHCGGIGYTFKKKCHTCKGEGVTYTTKRVTVNIPAGVRNSQTIKFAGMGYESKDPKGQTGDLIVECIYNIDNTKYAYDGYNLYENLSVPYYDCIIGTTKKVKLPNGKEYDITIKPHSQNGDKITLYNKGINGGNYVFYINNELPTNISKEEEQLLKEIQKLHN